MEHPITPPPELVQQWINEEHGIFAEHIATQAARWGADQELKACCEWLSGPCPSYGRELRTAMRPKPPSLAEEALETLRTKKLLCFDHPEGYNIIYRALQRLQELEKGNE